MYDSISFYNYLLGLAKDSEEMLRKPIPIVKKLTEVFEEMGNIFRDL